VPEMSKDLILYEGNTIDELRADFEAGIESYLAGCLADGIEPRKPYSGILSIFKRNLRLFRGMRKSPCFLLSAVFANSRNLNPSSSRRVTNHVSE